MAVKVQRPGVLEGISRDLFLLRIGAWLFQQVPMVQSDMVGLLDTWAFRFFDELDYVQEVGPMLLLFLFFLPSSDFSGWYQSLPYRLSTKFRNINIWWFQEFEFHTLAWELFSISSTTITTVDMQPRNSIEAPYSLNLPADWWLQWLCQSSVDHSQLSV